MVNFILRQVLSRVFTLLQMAVGVDFRGYKIGTIRRRIGRRIILQRQPGLEAYVSLPDHHVIERFSVCELGGGASPLRGMAIGAALASSDLPYAGKWKAQKGSTSPAKEIEFVSNGTDGLIVKIISSNAICAAKFDGGDYPAPGPQAPDGYTLAIKKAGPRAFEMVQKLRGKALYTSLFSVSEDGKT
jgi:hypothetical protein